MYKTFYIIIHIVHIRRYFGRDKNYFFPGNCPYIFVCFFFCFVCLRQDIFNILNHGFKEPNSINNSHLDVIRKKRHLCNRCKLDQSTLELCFTILSNVQFQHVLKQSWEREKRGDILYEGLLWNLSSQLYCQKKRPVQGYHDLILVLFHIDLNLLLPSVTLMMSFDF